MRRKVNNDRILECYDELGENLAVISYNRHNLEKVMASRNLNVLQAFREISLRSTKDTLCIIANNLPEDVVKFKEVKNYELRIDDIYYGEKIPKEVKERLKIKEDEIKENEENKQEQEI